jgi:pyruvate dehydrogenase E2 component (dihydrolipoamide acetyltransferase)
VPIIEIHVNPGDAVKTDDPLITLESDKATMDVPAPRDGTVDQLLVKVGDKVSEGTAIARLKGDGAAAGDDAPGAGGGATSSGSAGPGETGRTCHL